MRLRRPRKKATLAQEDPTPALVGDTVQVGCVGTETKAKSHTVQYRLSRRHWPGPRCVDLMQQYVSDRKAKRLNHATKPPRPRTVVLWVGDYQTAALYGGVSVLSPRAILLLPYSICNSVCCYSVSMPCPGLRVMQRPTHQFYVRPTH